MATQTVILVIFRCITAFHIIVKLIYYLSISRIWNSFNLINSSR
jgi:hypothetical protein